MIASERLRVIGRGGLGAVAAIMLTSAASAMASSPADWRTATRVSTVQAGGVRLITGGQLTSHVTSTAPPGADLRALTVEKASGGYSATLFFTGAFQQVDSYAGQPISHAVFISLRPPGGDELQIQLLPGGKGKIQRIQSGHLTDVGTAAPTVEGDHVTFPIPATLSPKPDWEIQGHVIMLRTNGSGFHKHTKPALIGALTGEAGAKMAFPSTGVVMENGKYLYWKHVDMPSEARPVSFNVERQNGKLIAVLTLAAPFKPVPSINGQAVDDQGAQFTFFETPESTGGYDLFWLALEERGVVVDLRDQQNPKQLGETKPTISGNQVRFDLSLIPLPQSLKSPKAQKGIDALFLEADAQETPTLKVADSTVSLASKGNGIVMVGVTTQTTLLSSSLVAAGSSGKSNFPWLPILGGSVAVLAAGGLVFRLRGGLSSTGTPVSPQDFAYSIERSMATQNAYGPPASPSAVPHATEPPMIQVTGGATSVTLNDPDYEPVQSGPDVTGHLSSTPLILDSPLTPLGGAELPQMPMPTSPAYQFQLPPDVQKTLGGSVSPPPPPLYSSFGPNLPPLQGTPSSPAAPEKPGSGDFDPFGIFSQMAEAESAPSEVAPQPTGPPIHDVTGDLKFPPIDVFGPLDPVREIRTMAPTSPPEAGGPTKPQEDPLSSVGHVADDGLEPPSRSEMPPIGAGHVDDDGLEPPSRSDMPPIGAAGQGLNPAGTSVGSAPVNPVPKTVAQQLADDCAEKKRKCAEARAAAKAASLKAYEASARAVNTARDCDAANKSLAEAEAALKAATGTPSTDRSWAELADGSRRVTAPDIRLPNAASQGVWDQYRSGQISAQQAVDQWTKIGSPEGIEALKKASREAGQPAIDQAKAKLDRERRWQQEICQKAADAARAADAAQKDADAANAKADAICAAAADCPE